MVRVYVCLTTQHDPWLVLLALLALDPGLPISYDVGLASFSIIASIAGAGFAFAAATRAEPRSRWIGILCLGADIAAMHYIGVAAARLPATVFWDKGLVTASILVGAALAPASLQLAFSGRGTLRMLAATLLLTCGEVQGFLFSKPISNAEVPSLLARFDLANADLCAAD